MYIREKLALIVLCCIVNLKFFNGPFLQAEMSEPLLKLDVDYQ